MTTLVATLDGVLRPVVLPLLRADDLGVLRGDGVFETILVVDDEPRDLDEHLARLQRSAAAIHLTVPGPEQWRPAIDAVLAGWAGEREMVLRLVATRGPEEGDEPTCYALGSDPSPAVVAQRAGVRVLLLQRGISRADLVAAPYLLAGAKTLSYAANMAAIRYAVARDADDVIFTEPDGTLLEGPTSTVVVARGRSLLTPRAEGILAGTTAARLFGQAQTAGWQTGTQALTAADLAEADGAYLTSSVRLLAPITMVDGEDRENDPDTTQLLSQLLQVPQ